MGKNEKMIMELILELIRFLLQRQQTGVEVTDEDLIKAQQETKDAIKNWNG